MTNAVVDVLVVGAGPVGLFCALELNRHGITCRIIDKKNDLSDKSKALGLHIRTLEIFKDCQLLDDVLNQGLKVKGVDFKYENKKLGRLDFAGIDANRHYLIDLPQDKTERILFNRLCAKNIQLDWNTELMNFNQSEDGVLVEVKDSHDRQEKIKCRWLIACDGAHSTVRQCSGLKFIGSEYHQNWWLADLLIDWEQPEDFMQIYASKHGPLACFPMGNKRYRLVLTAPCEQNQEPDMHAVETAFHKRSSDTGKLSNPFWITKFYIHHRQIEQYRLGRIFFAGDAAHIHSPLGGQGLNTGIQDIYNLVWKLALVLNKQASSSILDSYHAERYPVGREVLKTTDKMTRMILIKNKLLIKIRNQFFSWLLSFEPIRNRIANIMAELEISYADSPIVKNSSKTRLPKAGWFLTDFNLIDLKDNSVKCLSDIVQGTKHHLFLFAGTSDPHAKIKEVAEWVMMQYKPVLDVHIILKQPTQTFEKIDSVWLDEEKLHLRYGILKPTALLLRPDKYIGFTQSPVSQDELKRYLDAIFDL